MVNSDWSIIFDASEKGNEIDSQANPWISPHDVIQPKAQHLSGYLQLQDLPMKEHSMHTVMHDYRSSTAKREYLVLLRKLILFLLRLLLLSETCLTSVRRCVWSPDCMKDQVILC